MVFVRAMLLVLSSLMTLTAVAQTKLAGFVEKNGCKLLASEESVQRLQEIAAQGAVTWDGECKDGLITGNGVLRQEGTLVAGGKTKKFAYYLSGNARNGMRSGKWTRETFDRFVDSPRFYTSSATVMYIDGIAQGAPKPFPVKSPDQLSPSFRWFIAEAGRGVEAANKALQQLSAAPAADRQPATKTKVSGTAPSPVVPPTAPKPAVTDGPKPVVVDQLGNCWIDQINGKTVGSDATPVVSGQDIQVSGWAVDTRTTTVPEKTWLVLASAKTQKLYRATVSRLDKERPDVAKALGNSKFIKPGFVVSMPTTNLDAGDYTLSVVQDVSSEIQICYHKPTITVQKN